MDDLKPDIRRLFAAKEKRGHTLSALAYPEKVTAVVKLQEMAAPILRQRSSAARA